MPKKNSVLSLTLEGMASMFSWVPNIFPGPRTIEQTQDELEKIMARRGMKYHKTDKEAIASDWKKVGDDIKAAFKKPDIAP